MVFQKRRREGNSVKSRDVRGGYYSLSRGPFEEGHIFSVDREGTCRVGRGDGAVVEEVVAQYTLERFFGRTA